MDRDYFLRSLPFLRPVAPYHHNDETTSDDINVINNEERVKKGEICLSNVCTNFFFRDNEREKL